MKWWQCPSLPLLHQIKITENRFKHTFEHHCSLTDSLADCATIWRRGKMELKFQWFENRNWYAYAGLRWFFTCCMWRPWFMSMNKGLSFVSFLNRIGRSVGQFELMIVICRYGFQFSPDLLMQIWLKKSHTHNIYSLLICLFTRLILQLHKWNHQIN